MDLPRYCMVGARPVKLVSTPDGGMDCLAWSWDKGDFERDMRVLDRVVLPRDGDVDVVSQEEFEAAVARLRQGRPA